METKAACPASYAVCYLAIKSCIDPLKDSILACYDEIYHIEPDERIDNDFCLGALLNLAADVVDEIEMRYHFEG